jgi:P27 family predicted phage terminase small subunit
LSDEAKAEWRKTVKQLKAMGVLFESDQDLIAAYANALVNYRKATLMVDAEGLLIEGRRDGMVTNPAVRVQRDSAQLIRQLAQEFGLSPSSRTRIGTNGDTNDGLDDLLE